MSTGEAGSVGPIGLQPIGYPYRIATENRSTSGFSRAYGLITSSPAILCGFDAVAKDAEPTQCFIYVAVAGVPFYYDSQSTGEGLGIRFTWRGGIPVGADELITVNFQCSGTVPINYSHILWGMAGPYQDFGA